MTLIARPGAGVAITSAAVLSLLVGCGLAWLVFSKHLSGQLAFAPYAAVVIIYVVTVVPGLGRSAFPLPLVLAIAILGAFLTLLVGAVLIEMILCHYDPNHCINL